MDPGGTGMAAMTFRRNADFVLGRGGGGRQRIGGQGNGRCIAGGIGHRTVNRGAASLVISTKLNPPEAPVASPTTTAVIVSVPVLVWKVNASAMVAAPPGARVAFAGSVRVAEEWCRQPP